MKPWEENWNNFSLEENKNELAVMPWEENWQETSEVELNAKDYNGTALLSEPGENSRPFEKMRLFMDKLFTFEVSTGDEVKQNFTENPRIQALEKVRQDDVAKVEWSEVGKSVARESLRMGKGLTSAPFKIYGDWARDKRDVSLLSPEEAQKVKYNNFIADCYTKVGGYIEKMWDLGLNSELLKEDEKIFAGDFVDNPSLTRVLSLGAGAIPSILYGGGIAKITRSPTLAALALSGVDAEDIYWGAREKGKSPNEALALYAAGTGGTAVFEKYGLDRIYENKIMPLGKRIVTSVLSEGLTEGMQTSYQNMVKKYGYDDTQNLMEGVIESMIGGAIGGGVVSGTYGGYMKLQQARENLKEKGLSDDNLDIIQEGLAEEIAKHRDIIEPMFQQNINKSMSTLEKFITENEGMAEAQKALQTKQELEQVYKDVSERLKKAGVSENVANANAKIWQGFALFASQELGLSPMEYLSKRMPTLKKSTFAEFENRSKTLEEELGDHIPFQDDIVSRKQKQFSIIYENNRMLDDYHVGIRSIDDIKTFDEVINDEESFVWGDFSKEDAQKALKTGKITVYSSYPIKDGVFVSTSKRQAEEYAGGEGSKIYVKTIPVNDVAWINGDEGQYAKIKKNSAILDKDFIDGHEIIENFDETAPDNAFVRTKDGEIAHGFISQDLADVLGTRVPGDIRVYNDLNKHIDFIRKREILSQGYSDLVDFVDDTIHNWDKIYEGRTGSFLVIKEGGKDNIVAIRLEQERGYYKVSTVILSRKDYLKNKKTLAERAQSNQLLKKSPGAVSGTSDINNIALLEGNVNKPLYQLSKNVYDKQGKADISSKEFKDWFGDSKVVDENGRPLVAYHGTNAEFDVFKGKYHFFSDSENVAAGYGSENPMPVYLSMKNPLIVDAYGQSFGEIYNAEGYKKAYKDLTENDYKKIAKAYDLSFNEAKEFFPQNEDGVVNLARAYGEKPRSTNEWAEYAKKNGYDGVIIKDVNDTADVSNVRSTDYIVFEPNQIKSVYNRGTFSPESDNIYYQENFKPKGAYLENMDANGVIYLFEKADASTFMHESAHFWRKELHGFDTARSREMLQKMDDWENSEFDKRYKIREENGISQVTDTIGNVIYDDFATAETARDYAKNEIFARGFEQYLREGKAPNNYLKQAFRSFWNWLRHLYKTALDLDVELNDSIRSVYGDIIGGNDLDFYLSAPVDEVLQQHFAENEDRKKIYDEQIALAQMQPVKRNFTANLAQERTDGAKGRNEWWTKAMIPISTRAKRVSIKLRNKLRAYDYGLNTKINQYYAQIKPFLDKWAKMTETDAVAFDLALKNSYVEKQLEIVKKYDAYDEFVAVKNLLNSLFDQAVDVGIEMGYSADYFPRQIEDVEGFMRAMYGSPFASQLRRALKEADPDNIMTNEQKAEFFNKYLRGFNRRDLNKPLPGNTKDRSIDIVTAEMNKYYKPSMQALINYIEGMNTSIESRKFWGFKYNDINQSIGALTADLVDTGVITPEQDAEVQDILRARFKAKGVTNKWLNLQKNVSYIYTMGGINSAITQLDDISVALYKAGLWNTVKSVFSPNRSGLSREELGLERIGQEFVEASTSSKAVSTIFKLTGLDKIDAFGKNTLINATFNKFQKMAKNDEAALRDYLEPILETETNQTIEDIKNGEISDNVRLLMFNELADMQPIALSEMPEWYLTSGNGRVFYMLKTFMLKRLDIFRNECFDKMRQGDVKTGVQNLFRLAVLMVMAGSAKDAIIDMLFGRDFDLSDAMVNNILGLAGISKYSLYKARDEGFSGFASSFLIPPVFASSSDLLADLYKSLFSKKGKNIKDYEIWKGVPLIGRFYYWWIGGGRTKENRKKKKKLK